MKVQIKKIKDDPKQQIIYLIQILSKLEKSKFNAVIDLTESKWIPPFILLPISVLINSYGNLKVYQPKDLDLKNYLSTIHFPNGISKPKQLSYSKTYLPISIFQATGKNKGIILDALFKLLKKQLNLNSNQQNVIEYLINEMVDNVCEHAQTDKGWLFAQFYKNKRYIDVCII